MAAETALKTPGSGVLTNEERGKVLASMPSPFGFITGGDLDNGLIIAFLGRDHDVYNTLPEGQKGDYAALATKNSTAFFNERYHTNYDLIPENIPNIMGNAARFVGEFGLSLDQIRNHKKPGDKFDGSVPQLFKLANESGPNRFRVDVPADMPSVTDGASPALDFMAHLGNQLREGRRVKEELGGKVIPLRPQHMLAESMAPSSRTSFVPRTELADGVLGPYTDLATKNVRFPAFAVVDEDMNPVSVHSVREKPITDPQVGMLFPFISIPISLEEEYTVTGLFVPDKDMITLFEGMSDTQSRLYLVLGVCKILARKYGIIEPHKLFGMLYAWGEDTLCHEVRWAAEQLNGDNFTQSDFEEGQRFLEKFAQEHNMQYTPQGFRQRQPPQGPASARARIEMRQRAGLRRETFQSEEGIDGWWQPKMNSLRCFHVLPDQRFDLEFAGEILHSGEPYDFKRLMFPFSEFVIRVDSDWIDTGHVCDENCVHPPQTEPPEVSLFKPCGYIVRGDFDTGIWNLYEKHIARNEDRDLHMYTKVVMNQDEGTLRSTYIAGEGKRVFPTWQEDKVVDRVSYMAGHTAKFIINFLLILNHRGVKVTTYERGQEPGRPPSRAARRAEGYQDYMDDEKTVLRDHYKIYIPAKTTLYKATSESARGINVKERRPHDVRGHLRRDQYGRKRIKVRPFRRCRNSQKPYFLADYDAANVGMEV